MESLVGMIVGVFAIFLVIILAVYIVQGIILTKLNKLMYGKGTPMAWIPIFNTYLLGKLTVNKLVGWVLVICIFVTSNYTTTVNGVENTYSILPENISSIVSSIYSIVVFILFICAIVKYNKLKKQIRNKVIENAKQKEEEMKEDDSNKFCTECGFKIPKNSKFCMRCGKQF